MALALNVIQVEGCYVSSSLPKALFVPSSNGYSKSSREELYDKPKKKSKAVKDIHGAINPDEPPECPPIDKSHLAIQTDLYLEEICDVIEEEDKECQTDPALDRPTSPLFVPAKSGLDVATQIYPGDLFDFAVEVQPVLEALVGQTLEQAMIEIMEEEELAILTDLQSDFETRRNAEVAELKRLEEEDRLLLEERQRRLNEQEAAIILENDIAQKITACLFSQNYLSELVPQVFRKLDAEGYFDTKDPDVKEIEEAFWPWLLGEVDAEIATLEASTQLLDTLIDDSLHDIAETSVIKPVTLDFKPLPKPIPVIPEFIPVTEELPEQTDLISNEDSENINQDSESLKGQDEPHHED